MSRHLKKLKPEDRKKLLAAVKETRNQYWTDNKEDVIAAANVARDKMVAIRDRITDELKKEGVHWGWNLKNYPEYVQAKKENDEAWAKWSDWNQDNSPYERAAKRKERKKLKKRSRKNAKARIEVVDEEALEEVKAARHVKFNTAIEWPEWMVVGALVTCQRRSYGEKTKRTGLIVSADPKHPDWVEVMVEGEIEWFPRHSTRAADADDIL